jgi:hypothetical protein
LIGFTRLNNAHNGQRLGQALFKVIERIGIGHKVSLIFVYGQCSTLFIIYCKGWPYHMRQREQQFDYDEGAGHAFEYQYGQDLSLEEAESQVRQDFNSFTLVAHNNTGSCLAHVINLATQMLISTYSKSPHFDPKQPDAHTPTSRDEVGLVRAIVVKVWIIYLV